MGLSLMITEKKIKNMIYSGVVKKERYIGVTDSVMYIEATDNEDKKNKARDSLKREDSSLPKALARIIEIFGSWTAVRLSDFTHELATWERPPMFGPIEYVCIEKRSFPKKEF